MGAVSSAALIIRFAAEASPLVIGAYRLVIASAVILPVALFWPWLKRGHPADAPRAPDRGSQWNRPHQGFFTAWTCRSVLSGMFLALHLGAWIASLSHTSIASSTVLVTTTPVFLALLPARWRGDPLSGRAVIGVLIACGGAAVIALGDAGIDPGMAVGDGLALLGAMAMVGHRITGRSLLKGGMAPLAYLAVIYPVAALALGGLAVVLGHPLAGFGEDTYAALFALGLVPQLIGHSALNWALARVTAVGVSTAITGEPVGAILLALLVLGEIPTVAQLAGGVLVLAGTALVLREERSR